MGGRKINDHSSWAGSTAGGKVPGASKVMGVGSAEGAGALNEYQDTNEKIVKTQKESVSQANKHLPKEGYRH